MRSKFISFENAKISVGWHIEFGGAFFSEDIDNHKGIFNFATGPAFDYYLPFSTVGLSTSVNYKFTEIDFNTDPEAIMATDSLTLGWASVPFFIRFKTGGVSKPFRLVFMPGIEYNYPVYAEIKSNDTPSVRDINILNKHILYYRFQFAGEYVLDHKQSNPDQNIGYRTRLILYVSASYSPTSFINAEFSGYSSLALNDFSKLGNSAITNISAGISLFHTISSW